MNTDLFVEECRREWARLGVAREVADEMAAELRADLAEAATDGVPAEELLGSGAFDARGFAASWASERGVVPARPRRRVGVVAGAAVLLASIGLVAGLLSTRSTAPKHARVTDTEARRVVVLSPRTGALKQLVLQAWPQGGPRPVAVPRP